MLAPVLPSMQQLVLQDMRLEGSALAPFALAGRCTRLQALTLAGDCTLADEAALQSLQLLGPRIQRLHLRECLRLWPPLTPQQQQLQPKPSVPAFPAALAAFQHLDTFVASARGMPAVYLGKTIERHLGLPTWPHLPALKHLSITGGLWHVCVCVCVCVCACVVFRFCFPWNL